ncbi:unnamed protein product, partial [Amoebophrya sp. A120]
MSSAAKKVDEEQDHKVDQEEQNRLSSSRSSHLPVDEGMKQGYDAYHFYPKKEEQEDPATLRHLPRSEPLPGLAILSATCSPKAFPVEEQRTVCETNGGGGSAGTTSRRVRRRRRRRSRLIESWTLVEREVENIVVQEQNSTTVSAAEATPEIHRTSGVSTQTPKAAGAADRQEG